MARGPVYRECCGIRAERHKGRVWTWEVNGRLYRWDLWEVLEEVLPDGSKQSIACVANVDAAIAYSVGWNKGLLRGVFNLANGPEVESSNGNDPDC